MRIRAPHICADPAARAAGVLQRGAPVLRQRGLGARAHGRQLCGYGSRPGPSVEGAAREFHVWHRREELPRYAALLDEAAARLERGLTRDDVVWAVGAVRSATACWAASGRRSDAAAADPERAARSTVWRRASQPTTASTLPPSGPKGRRRRISSRRLDLRPAGRLDRRDDHRRSARRVVDFVRAFPICQRCAWRIANARRRSC